MDFSFGQQSTKVKQLSDIIGQDISLGKYKPDEALPSINQLSSAYNVSRDTVFKSFSYLKEMGIIDSTQGKGYYVVNRTKNILLLLDEYSPFKDTLYNSFVGRLSKGYKVDLWFHQYNERFFNAILSDAIGRYSRYVVMNFDNEKLSPYLNKIMPSKLLLLDFGKFDKNGHAYICQDFDESFCKALKKLSEQLHHYQKIVFLYPKGSKHPKSACDSFRRFCAEEGLQCAIRDEYKKDFIKRGEAYIVIRQSDVVHIIKESRERGMECCRDFGLIAYNETPSYEVIDKGITSLSVDWTTMGRMAADYILTGNMVQVYMPTEVHLRGSI